MPAPEQHTLEVDRRPRRWLLYRCETIPRDQPAPVVLAFHGAGATPESMAEFCGLHEKGAEAGFHVVYPAGSGRRPEMLTWNAGNCCGYAHYHQIDDVGFVRRLLDELPRHMAVDPARVFAAGMSNGAMLAYRLAAELSDRIAAIAAVAGPLALDNPQPSRPVPIIHFHGTDDDFAPYDGGVGLKSMYRAPKHSVRLTIETWAKFNRCGLPVTTIAPDTAGDATHIETTVYPAAHSAAGTHSAAGALTGGGNSAASALTGEVHSAAGALTGGMPSAESFPVILHTIYGGGHTWPGRQPKLGYLGAWTKNLDANEVIRQFFTTATRRTSTSSAG